MAHVETFLKNVLRPALLKDLAKFLSTQFGDWAEILIAWRKIPMHIAR